MGLELVIFDMDGLMIDTEPISKEGWRLAFERHGFELDFEFYSRLLGRNLVTAKELMSEYYGPSFDFEKVRKTRMEHMENHIKEKGLTTKKGLAFVLDKINELGLKKCVATSTEWNSMVRKLSSLNLMDHFDGFVSGDQVKVGKPDPEIFLAAAQLIGIEPAKCVVLEDSPAGVAGAFAAGMRAIVIPDMVQPDEETLKKSYAKCNDLFEAAEVIKSLAAGGRGD